MCVLKTSLVWTQALTRNETVEMTVLFKTNWLRKLYLCCQICYIRIVEHSDFSLINNQFHHSTDVALKIALWHRSKVVNANSKGSVRGLCKSDILV